MKILVIEDERSLQELIARALLKEHYVVEVASTYGLSLIHISVHT